jgi:hypothetical protein
MKLCIVTASGPTVVTRTIVGTVKCAIALDPARGGVPISSQTILAFSANVGRGGIEKAVVESIPIATASSIDRFIASIVSI